MRDWKLDKKTQFRGHTIKYGIKGSGPDIVLVHGTPWSSYNLRHLVEGLSPAYTVHFYDLLGYGQSAKPAADVSLGVQNELLEHLLSEWGISQPIIIGHDFGGATVLRSHILDHYPYRKIVLVNPVAVSPWGSPFFNHVKAHEAAFAGVPDYIHEAIVAAYIETAAHSPLEKKVLDNIIFPWTGVDGKAAFYRQIAQANSRFTEEIQSLYGEISVPVLILWGQEDSWIPVQKGHELHQLIPHSEFHAIPDAGHLVIEERPEILLQLITLYLNSDKNT